MLIGGPLARRIQLHLVGVCVLLAADVSAQPPPGMNPPGLVVTAGSDPSATLLGAVRLRNFPSTGTEKEIWVGVPPLSAPPVSAGGDVAWGTGQKILIAYHPTEGQLSVYTVAMDNPLAVPVLLVEKSVGYLGALNYIEVTIAKNVQNADVSFFGVLSPALSPPGGSGFGCPGCLGFDFPVGSSGIQKWNVTNIDLTDGFLIDGLVKLLYLLGAGDSDYVEIAVGYVPPPDTTGPITSNISVMPMPVLLNGNATVTAIVDDSTSGNNTVSSALYTLNGSWTPADMILTAQDGAFDEVSEEVEATFAATRIGLNEICVAGSDSLNNPGPSVCQPFLVTYKFTGFYSPIDNAFLNSAKAGQAIPARWRLTDANDVPVTHPESFQAAFSYEINCTEFLGDISDSIEEYAPGSGGLHYLRDGYWQFDWNTPKSYANTCRAMYIRFDSGATTPVVKFSFK